MNLHICMDHGLLYGARKLVSVGGDTSFHKIVYQEIFRIYTVLLVGIERKRGILSF